MCKWFVGLWTWGVLALPLAAAPCLVAPLPATTAEAGTLSVTRVDLAAAAQCWQPAAAVDAHAVVAAVRTPAGVQAVPTQYDPDPEGTGGELTVLLPPGPAGRELVVWFAPSPEAPRPVAPPHTVQLTRRGVEVVATSATYRVTHDPRKLAGLPSTIELLPSGKVFSGYTLNDRLYSHQGNGAGTGGYWLSEDTQAKLEVLAAGPLRTAVRVTAHYTHAGKRPTSQPRASYTFSYTAASPLVDLRVTCRQQPAVWWDELHVWELNFKDTSFTHWVGGDPLSQGPFTNSKKGWQKAWGALRDGNNLIGLLGAGATRFYDGREEYGTYLHGAWDSWGKDFARYRCTLFLSGAPGSLGALQEAAAAGSAPLALALLPESTAQALAQARARAGSAAPAAPLAARLRWWVRLTESLARTDLAKAHALARDLADEAALAPLANDAAKLDEWFQRRTGLLGLCTDQAALAFDGGLLVSLYDVGADRELLGGPSPLWSLQMRVGEKETVEYSPAVWAGGGLKVTPEVVRLGTAAAPALRLTFGGAPLGTGRGNGPEVQLDLQLTGGRVATRLKVNNRTALALERITTPVVRLGALGVDGADDQFFFPRGAGELQADPVGHGVQWGGRYPSGWSSMQYMAVYDPAGGLYMAAEDPVASTKETYGHGPDAAGTVEYGVNWPAPDLGVTGNDWEQPGEGALELFRGDWYDAAQVYRHWAEAKAQWWPARAKAKQTPERFRDNAVWVCDGASPYAPDNTVAQTVAFAKYMGVPTAIHWYNWHQIPFDTEYPHYDPPRARMAEGVAELQRNGVQVMPYINARLWDTWLPDFKAEAQPYATSDAEGKPFIEVYGSKRKVKVTVKTDKGEEVREELQPVKLAAMCPTTAFWQDKLRSIVLWLQNDVGVDGVYMDQVAAASPHLCMNKAHGHPLGGGDWWTTQGYWPLLAKLRAKMGPGKFLTTECNAEPYMQYYDGYLTWHWQFDHQVPAFSAVYADQVALFSRAYRGGKDAAVAMRQKAAQSLVFGEQIGWLAASVINQPGAVYLRECARYRYLLREFLAQGRMVRPPTLSGDNPAITADWQWSGVWPVTLNAVQTGAWRAADGRVVVLLANFSGEARTVGAKLDLADFGYAPGAVLKVTERRPEGAQAVGTWTGGAMPVLTVPAETVRAYELEAPPKGR